MDLMRVKDILHLLDAAQEGDGFGIHFARDEDEVIVSTDTMTATWGPETTIDHIFRWAASGSADAQDAQSPAQDATTRQRRT